MKKPSQKKLLDSHSDIDLIMEVLEGADDLQEIIRAFMRGSQAVLENQDFEKAAPAIFQACKEIVGANSGYVAILNEDGTDNMVVHLDPGELTCTVDTDLPMPIRGLRERAYRENKVIYDNNFNESEYRKFLPDGHVTLHNALFAPLVHEGITTGLVGLANKDGGFDKRDALLAGVFSRMAATALVNSQKQSMLSESEARLRGLFDQAGDAIFIIDPETLRFLDVNETAVNQLGYTKEELLSRFTVRDIKGDDTIPVEEVQRRLEEYGSVIYCSEHITKEGNRIPVEIHTAVIDYMGRKAFQSFARDISERVEWEKTVIDKRLLDSILNSTTDMFFLKDRHGSVRAANPAFCRYIDKPEEDILGKTNHDLFPKKYADIYTRDDKKVLEEGISLVLEEEGSVPKGEKRWYRVLKNPVHGDDGRIWGVIVLLSDITERKNTEEALKKSESKYKDLLNKAPVMLHSINKNGYLLNVSDEWLEVMGYERDEVIGRKSIEFITEKSQKEAHGKNLPNLFRTGKAKNVPNQFIRKNGEVIDVLVSANCEYDGRGEVSRTFAAITDITELKKAEVELKTQREKLLLFTYRQSLVEEKQRRDIAQELHDKVGQNLSMAKLRLMQSQNLLSKEKQTEIIEDVTETLDSAIKSTRTLVFDLSPPVLYELGLEAAIDWIAENMEKGHGIRISFKRPNEPLDIEVNLRVILFQVVKELIVNVVKHSEATEAHISLLSNDSNIVLEVTDYGKGFSVDDLKYRSTTDSGYGIFSIREKVSLLGGEVRIESIPGTSTTATVTIPSVPPGSEGAPDDH